MVRLRCLIFIVCLAFLATATASKAAELSMTSEDLKWLTQQSNSQFTDAREDIYYQWETTADQKTQTLNLIEKAYKIIFQTPLGKKICRQILFNDDYRLHVHNFKFHLGIRSLAASELANSCRDNSGLEHSPLFYYAGNQFPILKHNLLKSKNPVKHRRYSIITTARTTWKYDSWTDAANHTFIIFEHNELKSQITWEHLLRVLTHELAVYFDSKQNSLSENWETILSTQKEPPESILDFRLRLSLNNPLIQQILTGWRAYNFEEKLLRQISIPDHLKNPDDELSASHFSFLSDNDCRHQCLYTLLVNQASDLVSSALFLSAIRPQYRYETIKRYIDSPKSTAEIKKALIQYPDALLHKQGFKEELGPLAFTRQKNSHFIYTDFFFMLIDPIAVIQNNIAAFVTQAQYKYVILPDDLNTLNPDQYIFYEDSELDNLFKILTTPLLSSLNIENNHGPRPRIRTGAGSGGSQK